MTLRTRRWLVPNDLLVPGGKAGLDGAGVDAVLLLDALVLDSGAAAVGGDPRPRDSGLPVP